MKINALMLSVVATSLLYFLAFPPVNVGLLAFVALAPLLALLLSVASETPPTEAVRSERRPCPFLQGWLAGTAAHVGLLYWLLPTFAAAKVSPAVSVSALLALSAYLGLFWGVWAWSVVRVARHSERLGLWMSPLAWVACEFLRTHLFTGFPWVLLADSLYRHPSLIQVSEWTGVYGVSFIVMLANSIAAQALRRRSVGLRGLGAVAILLVLISVHRFYRLPKDDGRAPIRVALLQGSIDQYKKWDVVYESEVRATYAALSARAANEADLIIWPETSVPGFLLQDIPLRLWLTKVVWQTKKPHLLGSPAREWGKSYNAAYLINPSGIVEGRYAKRHLVPFGEMVPWSGLLGRFIPVLNALGGFSPGEDGPVVRLGSLPIGVNICYEAIFPGLVRQSAAAGAELIVNLTNDGWYLKTAAPYQHLAPNVFRAVENRRYVARANNTGVSAVIDERGVIVARDRGLFRPDVVTGSVTPKRRVTFYTRYGDVFAGFCLLVSAFLILRISRFRHLAARSDAGRP